RENSIQADRMFERIERCLEILFRLHRISGRMSVARIETYAEPFRFPCRIEHIREMFKTMPETRALAGRDLQQNFYTITRTAMMGFVDRLSDSFQTFVDIAVYGCSGVHNQKI